MENNNNLNGFGVGEHSCCYNRISKNKRFRLNIKFKQQNERNP